MSEPDRLTRIFLEACALPREARPAFLDASCAGDTALRSEIEAMLAADDRAEAAKEPKVWPHLWFAARPTH